MGKLYVYGMREQGCSIGAHPGEGFVDTEVDPLDEYRTVLVFSRRLSREECEKYDLDFLGAREQ